MKKYFAILLGILMLILGSSVSANYSCTDENYKQSYYNTINRNNINIDNYKRYLNRENIIRQKVKKIVLRFMESNGKKIEIACYLKPVLEKKIKLFEKNLIKYPKKKDHYIKMIFLYTWINYLLIDETRKIYDKQIKIIMKILR